VECACKILGNADCPVELWNEENRRDTPKPSVVKENQEFLISNATVSLSDLKPNKKVATNKVISKKNMCKSSKKLLKRAALSANKKPPELNSRKKSKIAFKVKLKDGHPTTTDNIQVSSVCEAPQQFAMIESVLPNDNCSSNILR